MAMLILLSAVVAIAQVMYLRRNPVDPVAGGRSFTAVVALGAGVFAIMGYLVQDLLGLSHREYNNKLHQVVGNNSFTLVYDSPPEAQALGEGTLRKLAASSRVSSSGIGYLGWGGIYLEGFIIGVAHGVAIGVLVAIARPTLNNIQRLLPASFKPRRFIRSVGESTWSIAKRPFRILWTDLDRHGEHQTVINLEFEITRNKTARTGKAGSILEWTTKSLGLGNPSAIAPNTNIGDTTSSMSRWRNLDEANPVGANLVGSPLPIGTHDALELLSMIPLAVGSSPNEPSTSTTRVKLPGALHAEDQGAGVPTTETEDQLKKKRRRSKASQAGRLKRAMEYAKKKEALNAHGPE